MENILTGLQLTANTPADLSLSHQLSQGQEINHCASENECDQPDNLLNFLELGLTFNDQALDQSIEAEETEADLVAREDQSSPIALQEFFNDLNSLLKQQFPDAPPASHPRKQLNRKKHCCSICQQTIHKKTTIYKLKCKHRFHSKCLDSWKVIKNNCPLCRLSLS